MLSAVNISAQVGLPGWVRGRGLALMRELSDSADIAGGSDGTCVTLRFDQGVVLADTALVLDTARTASA